MIKICLFGYTNEVMSQILLSGPFFICVHIMRNSATSKIVNNIAKIKNVVITPADETDETAALSGMMSCMAQGWRPTSATIQPHCEQIYVSGTVMIANRGNILMFFTEKVSHSRFLNTRKSETIRNSIIQPPSVTMMWKG